MKQITNFILGALAVFGVCTTASAEAIQTSTKDAPKYYLIKSNAHSRYLNARVSPSTEGGVLCLAASNADVTSSQLFRFEAGTTTGTYKIVNAEGFYLKSATGGDGSAQTLTKDAQTINSTTCDYEISNATTTGFGPIKAKVANYLNVWANANGDIKTYNAKNDANSQWIFVDIYEKAQQIISAPLTIGYPTNDSKAALQTALAASQSAPSNVELINKLITAISTSEASIMMPTNGAFYKIINDNDEPIYLTNNNGSLVLSKNAKSGFNDVWKCEIKDGKYQFYNIAADKYLKFLGASTGGSAADCAQFATAADATSFVMSANKQINLGCLPLNTSDNRFLLVKNTVAFDRDGKTYNKTSSNFSSDYKFEEVAVKEVVMHAANDNMNYSTWFNSSEKSVIVSGAETYIITNAFASKSDQSIKMTNTNKSIKGNEGAILRGENAKAYIMESETEATYTEKSILKGFAVDTEVSSVPNEKYIYTLGASVKDPFTPGMYLNVNAYFTKEIMPANRAYLEFNEIISGVKGFVFNFDNVTTGISTTINTTKANGTFDILGRRVNGAKGLQIINGKKVIK